MKEVVCASAFFGVTLSLAAYGLGMWLRRRWKIALCNPLLIATVAVIGVLVLLKIDYGTYYRSAGALSDLLTPSTVCLAIPLYEELQLLRNN